MNKRDYAVPLLFFKLLLMANWITPIHGSRSLLEETSKGSLYAKSSHSRRDSKIEGKNSRLAVGEKDDRKIEDVAAGTATKCLFKA